jgi:hypothetical protein
LRNAPGKPDRRREEEEGKNYRERLKGEQCGKSKLTEQQKKAGLFFFFFFQQNTGEIAQMLWLVIDLLGGT